MSDYPLPLEVMWALGNLVHIRPCFAVMAQNKTSISRFFYFPQGISFPWVVAVHSQNICSQAFLFRTDQSTSVTSSTSEGFDYDL